MKKSIYMALILVLACAGSVYAQEAAAPAEAQEAYGEVVSVNLGASAITITEYDYENDQDVNKTYTIDKAAAYENVKSLDEVKAGDWVALGLSPQKDGSLLVASVYVERYDLEEEMPATQTAPAAPEDTEEEPME